MPLLRSCDLAVSQVYKYIVLTELKKKRRRFFQ